MNDFTKEELQAIAEAIPYILHRGAQFRTELLQKIDSIICKHIAHECKHEWVSLFVIDEDNLRVLGGTGYKCLKCFRIIPQAWGSFNE